MSYIGIPPFGQTVRTVTTITASASQTLFTPNGGYTVGYVDVYYNGIKLVAGVDFTASNGTTVTLTAGATANAVIEIVAYGSVSLADSVRRSGDTFSGTVNFPNNNIIAANGNVGIGNTIPNAPLVVGSASGSFTNPLIQAAGNANSWIQINGQNLNNGNNASTDLVLSRSDGNDTAGYIDVGINSNTYAQAAYSIMTPRSGYVFTNGGDLSLGTQTAHNVILHTGNTTSASERMRITSGGLVGIGNTTPLSALHVTAGGANGIVMGVDSNDANNSIRLFALTNATGNGAIFYLNNAWHLNTGATVGSSSGTNRVNISPYGISLEAYSINTDGNGIRFPATQSSSTNPNTLDDYEEGTWTPTYTGTSTNPTVSYSVQEGRYVKIGKMVYCYLSIGASTHTGGSGTLNIGGLPFVSASFTYNAISRVTSWNWTPASPDYKVDSVVVQPSSSVAQLWDIATYSIAMSTFTSGSSCRVVGMFMYEAAT